MKTAIIFLLLGVFTSSAYAGFSIGMPGAVMKQAKKLDDKIKNKRLSEGWVLVPGNPAFGTSDFYVMAYEARQINFVATSGPEGTPWIRASHKTAVAACAALGGGAHLITIPEVQTINRNIEAQPSNWGDGVVGSLAGGLKRGNCSGMSLESGIGRDYAKFVLSNGVVIWDWSGNVWEWIYGDGPNGTLGTPGGVAFNGGVAYEWDSVNLNEERPILGPSNSSWTSVYGVGRYDLFNVAPTETLIRGGSYRDCSSAGVFEVAANGFVGSETYGFRCAR